MYFTVPCLVPTDFKWPFVSSAMLFKWTSIWKTLSCFFLFFFWLMIKFKCHSEAHVFGNYYSVVLHFVNFYYCFFIFIIYMSISTRIVGFSYRNFWMNRFLFLERLNMASMERRRYLISVIRIVMYESCKISKIKSVNGI